MVVVVLAGCTAAEPEPEADVSRVISSYSEVVLPLDAYRSSNEAVYFQGRALDLLVRDCMARYGFDWWIAPVFEVTEPDHDRRYGILDASTAREHGYGRDPSLTPELPDPPPISAAAERVHSGDVASVGGLDVPPGGCAGEATGILIQGVPPSGDQPGGPGLTLDLSGEAYRRAESDSRVRAAWGHWSECMRGRGFDYDRPWDAHDDDRWQDNRYFDLEVSTATADVACRQETNLVGIWYGVEVAYQQRLVEQNAEALAAEKAYADALSRNAAKVLADHGEASA